MKTYTLTCEGKEYEVSAFEEGGKVIVTIGKTTYEILLDNHQTYVKTAFIQAAKKSGTGRRLEFGYQKNEKGYTLLIDGATYTVQFCDPLSKRIQTLLPKQTSIARSSVEVRAPIPGRITDIKVKNGEPVKKDQPLLILDAMKLENEILSPGDGKVKDISVKVGEAVEKGQVLVVIGRS